MRKEEHYPVTVITYIVYSRFEQIEVFSLLTCSIFNALALHVTSFGSILKRQLYNCICILNIGFFNFATLRFDQKNSTLTTSDVGLLTLYMLYSVVNKLLCTKQMFCSCMYIIIMDFVQCGCLQQKENHS